MALYVPLDVDFATDPKFLAAGPLAGYLFICSLALAKRTQSDGHIDRTQLVAISIGIPNPSKHARTLVEVGLWAEAEAGWQIASWLKRNMSREEIAEKVAAKREGGEKGNHNRWHVDGKRSDDCRYCIAEAIARPIAKRSPEVEVETKAEPKVEPPSSVGASNSDRSTSDDDDVEVVKTLTPLIEREAARFTDIGNPRAWKAKRLSTLVAQVERDVNTYGGDSLSAARALAGVKIQLVKEPCANPECVGGWVYEGDVVGRCSGCSEPIGKAVGE